MELVSEGTINVNSIDYYKYTYEIKEIYYEETLTTGVDIYVGRFDGTFITIKVTYYRDDPVNDYKSFT